MSSKKKKKKITRTLLAKAIFMIILVISLPIVTSSLLSSLAKAQDDGIDFGCCKGTEGYACQMTTKEKCKELVTHEPDLNEWVQEKNCSASEAKFCNEICCFKNSECYKHTPEWLCLEREGDIVGNKNCSDVPKCIKGCCFFDTLAVWATHARCTELGELYSTTTRFDGETTEYECLQGGKSFEWGCCRKHGECKWVSRDQCEPEGTFHKDIFCSAPELSDWCDCTPHAYSDCYKNSWDVYWFDSCGNPEDIKEPSCDFLTTGKRCINGECSDISCKAELPNGTDMALKDGECICVFDQELSPLIIPTVPTPIMGAAEPTIGQLAVPTTVLGKYGIDVVGSRHWRWCCINGELEVRPCADYRQEICLDGTIEIETEDKNYTFRSARCRKNMWEDCLTKKTRDECVNAKHLQCWWFGDDEQVKEWAVVGSCSGENWMKCMRQPSEQSCEDEGCEWSESEISLENIAGFSGFIDDEKTTPRPKCLPKYAPAYDIYDIESNNPCSLFGTYICDVEYEEEDDYWDCTSSSKKCKCDNEFWPKLMAKRCVALGDCGLNININKKFSSGADPSDSFSEIMKRPNMIGKRFTATCELEGGCPYLENITKIDVRSLLMSKDVGWLVDEIKGYTIYDLNSSLSLASKSSESNFGETLRDSLQYAAAFIIFLPLVAAQPLIDPLLNVGIRTGVLDFLKVGAKVSLVEVTPPIPGLTFREVVTALARSPKAIALGIAAGIAAGVLVYGALRYFGVDQRWANSIAWGAGAGTGVLVGALVVGASFSWATVGVSAAIGAIIGIIVWIFGGGEKEVKVDIYQFECQPWQPPFGGDDCELCNKDPMRPCSEYRCKSLGAACNFTCDGEENEFGECVSGHCFWTDPTDVIAPKIVNVIPLTNHSVLDPPGVVPGPPGGGATVVGPGGSEINPFEQVMLNIATNEVAYCIVAFNHTSNYSDMEKIGYSIGPQLGNPNGPGIGHILVMPIASSGPEFIVYIRCADLNGNVPEPETQEFKLTFKVADVDVVPPEIASIIPSNNSAIVKTLTKVDVTLTTNELVDGCKWERNPDIKYDSMTNSFNCMVGFPGSTCNASLPFDGSTINEYYIKCKDISNVTSEDILYVLKPADPLEIVEALPNKTKKVCENGLPSVSLTVKTAKGCCNGAAECYYEENGDYIKFNTTGTTFHKHEVELPTGITDFSYHIVCTDAQGISAETMIEFKVEIDTTPPIITRIYKSGYDLKIHTDEPATCAWNNVTCDFKITKFTLTKFKTYDNITHTVDWQLDYPWYVKCEDDCGIGGKIDDPCITIIPQELE